MKSISKIEEYIAKSLIETQKIATEFSKKLKIGDITVLKGDLGVGKTEFIRTICSNLGVNGVINSPSFAIINQYELELLNIFHIDLYRITNPWELINIGFYELFDSPNSVFFIEWAENSFNMIPHINYIISMKLYANSSRNIEINAQIPHV